MSNNYERLHSLDPHGDLYDDDNDDRDRLQTDLTETDLAPATSILPNDQDPNHTLQNSMQSDLLDEDMNNMNNTTTHGTDAVSDPISNLSNISHASHASSHTPQPLSHVSGGRPIRVVSKNEFRFDSNSMSNNSTHSLIANPYISIDKQTAREKEQQQQQQLHQHSEQLLQQHKDSNKSGSIQAPSPPSKLVRTYSPFTPRGAVMLIQDKIQPGSIKGSIFNIVISTVGGGILSLSYGIRYFGYVGGLILLIFSGILSYISNDLMLVVCENMNPNIKPSFKTMSERAGGRGLAIFTQVVLLLQMFGGYISYQVAAGGLIDLAYSVFFEGNIYIWAVLFMSIVIMFPLSLLNSMSKLRFTSLLGITCSIYLSVVIFSEYFLQCKNTYSHNGHNTYGQSRMNSKYLPSGSDITRYNTCFWDISNFYLPKHAAFPFNSGTDFATSFLTCFPLFIFSFTCNQYMLPIYVELQRRSRRRMKKVLRRGFSIITIMYIFSSMGGFMSFLFATCGNILLNNFEKHVEVVIAAVAISISMILTNPITMFAWRQNFSLLIWGHRDPLPQTKHLTITITFTLIATMIALSVTDIAAVFGLLGATTYPTIGFVLPGIFFVRIVPDVPRYKWQRRLAWFMMLFVGLSSVSALVYQIYTFIIPNNDAKCANVQTIQGPDW